MLRLEQGEKFAGCRILSICGSGGMGVVYLAEDALGRTIALKIVSIVDSERELNGIRKYIQIAQGCPNLIQIYHAGIEKDYLFYIMEAADPLEDTGSAYIPKTLSAILNKNGKIDPDEALLVIRTLASGLEVLHRSDLIHRDIKPENIVYVNNVPKLCDPGLVCEMEAAASFVGTLGYLPHECFNGLNLNSVGRDIYALGKVFYVAVTGESAARYPYLPLDLPLNVRRQLWPILTRVCENDPKSRFQSVVEFCESLPKRLARPTKFEYLYDHFLRWRLTHPGTMMALLIFMIFFIVAGAGGTGYYFYRQKQISDALLEQKKKEFEQAMAEREERISRRLEFQKKCEVLEKRIRGKEPMLPDHIAAVKGKKEAARIESILKTLPSDSEKRFAILQKLDRELGSIALSQIPKIPGKSSFDKVFSVSSKVRGLFASPLGAWIPSEKKNRTLKELRKLENLIFPSGFTLKPGRDFAPDPSYRVNFIYVPAGSYRNKKGKIITVPNAFWCSNGEIRIDHFCHFLERSQSSPNPEIPMTKFSWNDLLSYCRKMTVVLRSQGAIPEGFIFRPLTTKEWEWACRGAWSGTGSPTVLLRNNSGKRAHAVLAGIPNQLGIYNMLGNVGEITMPDQADPYNVRVSGGWYDQAKADPEHHTLYLKYQFLPPYIGSRVAIAPGSLDFFEKQLWVTGERQLTYKGNHYEFLATNETSVTFPDARKICSFMGGKLFVPESSELLQLLRKSFFESGSFPVSADAEYKNGKWMRPDGKPYTGLKMPSLPKYPKWSFVYHGGRLTCFRGVSSTGVICQWTKEEYLKRTDLSRLRRHPAVLHSFEIGEKVYLLLAYRSHNHVLRRIAQLVGGRMAEPSTPEIRARFQKELAPWKEKDIMLGGIWMHDHWQGADGSRLDLKLTLDGTIFRESLHSATPGLHNGNFHALQKCQLFLLEFSSDRNRSRASGISMMH